MKLLNLFSINLKRKIELLFGILISLFLIYFSNLLFNQLPQVNREINIETFLDNKQKIELIKLQNQLLDIKLKIENNNENSELTKHILLNTKNKIQSVKEKWNNELIISNNKKSELDIKNHLNEIVALKEKYQTAEIKNNRFLEMNSVLEKEVSITSNNIYYLEKSATKLRNDYLKYEELKIFLYRVFLFILLLTIIVKTLKNKSLIIYKPFVWGLISYILIMPFIEIMPHLPRTYMEIISNPISEIFIVIFWLLLFTFSPILLIFL